MRLTLSLSADRPWPQLQAQARQAEHAGWDAVRVDDGPPGPEPWALAGALAVLVPRVRLEVVNRDDRGRHPAVVAKLASTVDLLSDGRVTVAWVPAAGGEERLDEACQVLALLSTVDRADLSGRFFRLRDAPLDPKPRQQPLPILLIGSGPSLAARRGDGWEVAGTAADVEASLDALAEACRAQGRDRSTITVAARANDSLLPGEAAVLGVDEWVVADRALGPDPAQWAAELAAIRASIPA